MTAGNTGPPRRRWADADGISALQKAVITALQGSPYTVIDTEGGFEVQPESDYDERWRGAMSRGRRHSELRWVVKERPGSYAVTDVVSSLRWSAGLTGFDMSGYKQVGRDPSFSRTNIWALTDTGGIERVADFRFNSREGRDVIRLAARQLGLKERLPRSVQVTIAGVAAMILAAVGLFSWLKSHPGNHGPSPSAVTVNAARVQLVDAAHGVVTSTTLDNLNAGFAFRSCSSSGGFPYRGELTLHFDIPGGPQHVEALNTIVGQLITAGWTDGLPPGHRDRGDPLVPDEVATLHRGEIAAHVRRGNPVNHGPVIELEGPCGSMRATQRHPGYVWDVTEEVR